MLKMMLHAGEGFLGLSSGSIDWSTSTSAGPELSSLWANLELHLTDLIISINDMSRAQHLDTINTLRALHKLWVFWADPKYFPQRVVPHEKFALKLPHLVNLRMFVLVQGELILSCPQLAIAYIAHAQSLHIKVEEVALERLDLVDCKSFQMEMQYPEPQLERLRNLHVADCSEVGRHLIEDVGLMRQLRRLYYGPLPAAYMPSSFPKSLKDLELIPVDWCCDIPGGLKELPKLTQFCFSTNLCKSWRTTRPLAELLPMDTLDSCKLITRPIIPSRIKAKSA